MTLVCYLDGKLNLELDIFSKIELIINLKSVPEKGALFYFKILNEVLFLDKIDFM